MVRVEPRAFGSVVGALPTEVLGDISNLEYFINIKIENMLYGLRENFEILSKLWRTLYFSFCQVINIINQCYRLHNVTVFVKLIPTSFKLIYDMDLVNLSI